MTIPTLKATAGRETFRAWINPKADFVELQSGEINLRNKNTNDFFTVKPGDVINWVANKIQR